MGEKNNPCPPCNSNYQVPTRGRYYTIDNVENSLPKIPVVKQIPKLDPYGSPSNIKNEFKFDNKPNGVNSKESSSHGFQKPAHQPAWRSQKSVNSTAATKNNSVNNIDITPWFLKPFASPTPDRANGRAARIIKLGLRNQEGKRSEAHIIFLMYQMMTGALGGILMGIETGYLTLVDRQTPVGNDMLVLGKSAEKAPSPIFRTGIIFWRTTKRAMGAALLFNFIEKNIEESRNKSDWKNSAYTGAFCGLIYGLRGGFSCAMTGCAVFAAFGGLSGMYEQLKRKNKDK